MKIKKILFICAILLLNILIAGCSSPQSQLPPPTTAYPQSQIHVINAGTVDEWSLSLGCYSIATGYAYNTGNTSVSNVVVYISLKYTDGTIRDSKVINLGTIEPQGSRSYQINLDRECGDNYYIDVSTNY